MIAFKVKKNNEEVTTAGDSRNGMTSFTLSNFQFEDTEGCNSSAYIQGVYGDKSESVLFIEYEDIKVGDEFILEVCEVEKVDQPLPYNLFEEGKRDIVPIEKSKLKLLYICIGLLLAVIIAMTTKIITS